MLVLHEVERANQKCLQLATVYHGIQHSMLKQKFAALEALRQLLSDGLLNHARAGKSDERARLGNVQIAKHGEAGRDAAGGRVGEDAEIRNGFIVHLGQTGRDFCQLHQAGDTFHHARSARGRDDDERLACGQRAVYGAGNGFANHCSHAAADKRVLHSRNNNGVMCELSLGIEDGVEQAGGGLGLAQARLIALDVCELERVCRTEVAINEGIAGFEQHVQTLAGTDAEVARTLGADVEVGLEVGLPKNLTTAIALDPQSFCADAALAGDERVCRWIGLTAFTFEPGHRRRDSQRVRCHYRRSGGGWDRWGCGEEFILGIYSGWYDSEKKESPMRGVLTVLLLIALFSSFAQAEDSAALMARLQKANDLTRLDDPSLKPWHLQANFQLYDDSGKPTEKGTLEEWWAGPKLWKRVYTSPSYTATQIANKNGFFKTPKVDPVPELLELVERQYVHPMPDEKEYKDTEPELRQKTLGNFEADCIMLDRPKGNDSERHLGFDPTYCFGSDKVTLRETIEHISRYILRNKIGLFQSRSVPVALDISQNNIDLISSEVTTLRASDLDDEDFAPDAALEKVDRFEVAKRPIPISSGVMAGMILSNTQPAYPLWAKDNHITGDVVIEAVIGKDGHIHNMRVLASPDPSLSKAAQDAVSKWIYKPYLLNGVLVEVQTQITVKFTLNFKLE